MLRLACYRADVQIFSAMANAYRSDASGPMSCDLQATDLDRHRSSANGGSSVLDRLAARDAARIAKLTERIDTTRHGCEPLPPIHGFLLIGI